MLVQEDAIKVIVKSGLPEIYVNLLVIIYLMDNTRLDQVSPRGPFHSTDFKFTFKRFPSYPFDLYLGWSEDSMTGTDYKRRFLSACRLFFWWP